MGDGRTPTLTIAGNSQTVVFVDERSAYPFPPISVNRVYQERLTRRAFTGPGKTVRVYRLYSGSEQKLDFQATLVAAEMQKLLGMSRQDPPTVTVTYLETSWAGSLASFSASPDELGPNDATGPLEYLVSGSILRDST